MVKETKVEDVKEEVKEVKVKEEKLGACPWCAHQAAEGEDLVVDGKNLGKYPKTTVVAQNRTTYQCGTCGKDWKKADLGKPWTEALEKGEAWARENQARQLRG